MGLDDEGIACTLKGHDPVTSNTGAKSFPNEHTSASAASPGATSLGATSSECSSGSTEPPESAHQAIDCETQTVEAFSQTPDCNNLFEGQLSSVRRQLEIVKKELSSAQEEARSKQQVHNEYLVRQVLQQRADTNSWLE